MHGKLHVSHCSMHKWIGLCLIILCAVQGFLLKSQERPNRGSRLFVHKNTFQSSNQPNELKSQRPYWNKVQSTKHRKAKVLSKNKAAQLDLQLELYPDFLRHLVAAAASSLMEAFEEHNALRFVSQLKRLASKTPILAATEFSKHLLVWMEEMADKVGTTELPDWIWSLGKLGYSYQDYKFRLIVNKALTKFCSASNLSGKDITTTLGGLHRAGVTWKNLPDSLRLSLLKIISDGSLLFNSREISNTLYAVQRMGIPWTEFDMDQRKQIRRSIVAQKNNMNDQEASNTVYSLGLLGEDYSQLTTEEVDAVFTIVKSGMMATKNPPRNVCQQNANLILGLTKMNFHYNSLPVDIVQHIESSLLSSVLGMNDQETSNTIYALGTMSFPWKDLNNQLKDIWQQHAVTVFPSMVRQGVSTTIYGLACMQADWSDLHPDFQDVFQKQVIHCLHIPNLRSQLRVSQVISNIFYGLGKCKAPWQSLTTECRQTLLDAILTCSEEFGGHEVGNIAYGLGGMIAPFQELPPAIFDTLAAVMDRVAEDISQTELCSILHGLVNIDASWSRMTERFKTALINIIRSQAKLDYICLACITYCMGKYGAMWRDLPKVLCATLEKELALSNSLADQTLSNTIYGMGLMNVRWDDLPDVVRVSLFQVLGSSDAFASFKPQHISNTLWGLARMETIWSDLPTHNLEDAMNRMLSAASAQELANAIFGLGGLETTWSILQLPTIQTLAQAIESCYLRMNTQEVANSMYSLTLMTFDCDFSLLDGDVKYLSEQDKVDRRKLEILLNIHDIFLQRFPTLAGNTYTRENYDQFSIYFEAAKLHPCLKSMIVKRLRQVPKISGPSMLLPSRTHASIAVALSDHLAGLDDRFSIFNEFSGLAGIFPIDIAVYYDDELYAFIEVDGSFHYRSDGSILQSKDRLKECLYKQHYPTVPLYRIKRDQIMEVGPERAALALAIWMTRGRPKKTPIIKEVSCDTNAASIASSQEGVSAAPVDKKRGRPKKQPLTS